MQTKLGVGDVKQKPIPELIGKTVLERYKVEAVLGKGAMGTVFRGSHHKLARSVAIKVLHEHLCDDPTMLARFQREAQVAARLQHPNLISVLDIGETDDGLHVMVLELAKGKLTTDPASHTGEGIFFTSRSSFTERFQPIVFMPIT